MKLINVTLLIKDGFVVEFASEIVTTLPNSIEETNFSREVLEKINSIAVSYRKDPEAAFFLAERMERDL